MLLTTDKPVSSIGYENRLSEQCQLRAAPSAGVSASQPVRLPGVRRSPHERGDPRSAARPAARSSSSAMDAVSALYSRAGASRSATRLPGEAHFAAELGREPGGDARGVRRARRAPPIDVGNGRKPRVGAMDGAVMAASLDHAVVDRTGERARNLGRAPHDRAQDRRACRAGADRGRGRRRSRRWPRRWRRASTIWRPMCRYDIAFHEAIARGDAQCPVRADRRAPSGR